MVLLKGAEALQQARIKRYVCGNGKRNGDTRTANGTVTIKRSGESEPRPRVARAYVTSGKNRNMPRAEPRTS